MDRNKLLALKAKIASLKKQRTDIEGRVVKDVKTMEPCAPAIKQTVATSREIDALNPPDPFPLRLIEIRQRAGLLQASTMLNYSVCYTILSFLVVRQVGAIQQEISVPVDPRLKTVRDWLATVLKLLTAIGVVAANAPTVTIAWILTELSKLLEKPPTDPEKAAEIEKIVAETEEALAFLDDACADLDQKAPETRERVQDLAGDMNALLTKLRELANGNSESSVS